MTPARKDPHSLADPAAHLPLTPLAFHILLALADTDLHGYGIIRDIEDRTDGRMRVRSGTLYTAIYRLAGAGLVGELATADAPAHGDRRRRYFRITDLGRRVAGLEAHRLAELVTTARDRALLSPAGR